MRTSRPWLWAVISVVLAAGPSGGVAVAQAEADASPLVAVTATRDCVGVGDALVEVDTDGTEHLRFLVSRCTLTSDDKGLDGAYILVTHTDCYPDGSCTVWGTIETEEPDGWRGSYRGWVDADGVSHTVSALDGLGSFVGLTFVSRGMGDLGLGTTAEVQGVIYAGTPPRWDEAPPE